MPQLSEENSAPRWNGMSKSSPKYPRYLNNDKMSVHEPNDNKRDSNTRTSCQSSTNGRSKKASQANPVDHKLPASPNSEGAEEAEDSNIGETPKDDKREFAYGIPANDLIESTSDLHDLSEGFTTRLHEKIIAIYDVVFRTNLLDNSGIRFDLGPAGIHLGQTITITRHSNKYYTKATYRAHFHFPTYESGNLTDVKQNFDALFDCQVLDPEMKIFGEFKLLDWCTNIDIQCRDVNDVILNTMWKINDDNGFPLLQWQLRSGYSSEENHGILGWGKLRHGVEPNGPPAVLTGAEKKRIDVLQNVQGIHWLNPTALSSALKEHLRVEVGGYPEHDEKESLNPDCRGSEKSETMGYY